MVFARATYEHGPTRGRVRGGGDARWREGRRGGAREWYQRATAGDAGRGEAPLKTHRPRPQTRGSGFSRRGWRAHGASGAAGWTLTRGNAASAPAAPPQGDAADDVNAAGSGGPGGSGGSGGSVAPVIPPMPPWPSFCLRSCCHCSITATAVSKPFLLPPTHLLRRCWTAVVQNQFSHSNHLR